MEWSELSKNARAAAARARNAASRAYAQNLEERECQEILLSSDTLLIESVRVRLAQVAKKKHTEASADAMLGTVVGQLQALGVEPARSLPAITFVLS